MIKLWFRSLDDKLINTSWSAFGVRKLVTLDNMSKGSVLTSERLLDWSKQMRLGDEATFGSRKRFLGHWSEQKMDDRQSRYVSNFIGDGN